MWYIPGKEEARQLVEKLNPHNSDAVELVSGECVCMCVCVCVCVCVCTFVCLCVISCLMSSLISSHR